MPAYDGTENENQSPNNGGTTPPRADYPGGTGATDPLAEMFGGYIESNANADLANTLATGMKKVMDETNHRRQVVDNMSVIVLDKRKEALAMSCVCLTYTSEISGKKVSATHTIQLGATCNNLAKKKVRVSDPRQQVEYEYTAVPSDVYTTALKERVRTKVLASTKANDWVDGSTSIVPPNVDVSSIEYVEKLTNAWIVSCVGPFSIYAGHSFAPFGPDNVEPGSVFHANVTFDPQALMDIHGSNPIRRDLSVSINHTVNSKDNGDEYMGRLNNSIAEMSGYMDMVYVTPDPVQPGYGMPVSQTQVFQPRLVITDLRSDMGIDNLAMQLMALSTAVILVDNRRWANVYRGQYSDKGAVNPRDITALGYEAKVPDADGNLSLGRINQGAGGLSPQALNDFLSIVCRPDLLISMHIPEEGPQNWLHNIFLQAALGKTKAIRAIIDAADTLTGNNFSKYWNDETKPMARVSNDRIALGWYYTDSTRTKVADIRDFDYLAMLNIFGDTDLDTVVAYDRTHTDGDDLAIRMSRRETIQTAAIPNAFKYTGYATPIDFNFELINCLARAIQDAGMAPTADNIHGGFAENNRRGVKDVMNFAGSAQAPSGYYNTAGATVRGGFQRSYSSGSIWG